MKPLVCVAILALATAAAAQQPTEPKPTPGISVIHFVAPKYPPLAKTARIQGDVRLLVEIAPDGSARNILVLRGHPMLAQNAIDAVKQWHFGCQRCEAPLRHKVTVHFVFDDRLAEGQTRVEPNLPASVTIHTDPRVVVIACGGYVTRVETKQLSDMFLDFPGRWLGGSDVPRVRGGR